MVDQAAALERVLNGIDGHENRALHVRSLLAGDDGSLTAEKQRSFIHSMSKGEPMDTLVKILELLGGQKEDMKVSRRHGLKATTVANAIVEYGKRVEEAGPCDYCGQQSPNACQCDTCEQQGAFVHHFCVTDATANVCVPLLLTFIATSCPSYCGLNSALVHACF